MKVATPDTMSDMDTRKLVVSVSSLSALAMMSGGVTMATNMANRCWAAAKSVSRKGGRSLSPYIKPLLATSVC